MHVIPSEEDSAPAIREIKYNYFILFPYITIPPTCQNSYQHHELHVYDEPCMHMSVQMIILILVTNSVTSTVLY